MLRFKSKELSFIISVWYFGKHTQAESNLHKRNPCRQRLGRNQNLGLQGAFQPGCWGSVPAVTSTAVLELGKAVVWQREKKQQLLPSPWLVQSALDKVTGLGQLHFLQSELLLEMALNFAYNMLSQGVLLTLISSFLSPAPFLSSAWNVSWGFDSFYLIISSFCMEDCWAPCSEVTTSLEFLNICLPSYLLRCQTLDISLPSTPHPVSVMV